MNTVRRRSLGRPKPLKTPGDGILADIRIAVRVLRAPRQSDVIPIRGRRQLPRQALDSLSFARDIGIRRPPGAAWTGPVAAQPKQSTLSAFLSWKSTPTVIAERDENRDANSDDEPAGFEKRKK